MAIIAAPVVPVVLLIQAIYDAAGIPTENRFGFLTNVGYETVWYAVHVALAAGIRLLFRFRTAANEDRETPR